MWGLYVTVDGSGVGLRWEGQILGSELGDGSRSVVPIRMQATDDDGLLKLSATPYGIDPDRLIDPATGHLRREDSRKQLSGFDVDFPRGEVGFLMPLPRGTEPVTRPRELAVRVYRLLQAPSLQPLEVRVRRAPWLAGTVATKEGKPLQDVTVFAIPIDPEPHLEDWLEFQNAAYEDMAYAVRTHRVTPDWYLNELLFRLRDRGQRSCEDSIYPHHHPVHGRGHTRRQACDTTTSLDGRYSLGVLCRGLHLVGAYRHDTGYMEARLQLAGDATQDFTLDVEPFGRLEVVVHFESLSAGSWPEVDLALRRIGPTGAWLPLDESHERDFDRVAFGGSPVVFRIERVPVGPLALTVLVSAEDVDDLEDSRTVAVAAGRTTRVEFRPGAMQHGRLRPIVHFDGKQVEEVLFFVQSMQTGEIDDFRYRLRDDNYDDCTLPAGDYKLFFQGLESIACTIRPDAVTEIRIELAVAVVDFRVDMELYDLMRTDSDEQALGLDLRGTSFWADSAHLDELGKRMAEKDESYDRLLPGRARTWTLPPGRYLWELWASEGLSLAGELEVKAGHQVIRFSLDNLPGLGAVRIDLAGFSPEESPVPSASGITTGEHPWCRVEGVDTRGPSIWYPQEEPGPDWYRDIKLLRRDRQTCWIVTGHGRRLRVHCIWTENEIEHMTSRSVSVPGSVQFRREDPAPWGTLEILRPDDEYPDYAFRAFSDEHTFREVDFGSNPVPQGTWHLSVQRSRWSDDLGWSVVDFASLRVHIGSTPAQVDLSGLTYRPAGRLIVHLAGRGTVSPGIDSWWQASDYVPFASPVLQYLDQGPPGHPPIIPFSRPEDAAQPAGGQPLLVYRPRLLPPGRYRLLPWLGAPGALAREFEIKPGQTTTIVLKGG